MAAPCTKRSPTWSTLELLDLLSLCGKEAVQSHYCSSHRNFDAYGQISHGMLDKGYERDMHQCCVKIKQLVQVYQKSRELNRCSGAVLKTCCFYKELNTVLCHHPPFTAKSPMDISGGLETVACELNLKDESGGRGSGVGG